MFKSIIAFVLIATPLGAFAKTFWAPEGKSPISCSIMARKGDKVVIGYYGFFGWSNNMTFKTVPECELFESKLTPADTAKAMASLDLKAPGLTGSASAATNVDDVAMDSAK